VERFTKGSGKQEWKVGKGSGKEQEEKVIVGSGLVELGRGKEWR
jgi:hypothetical protein